MIIGVTDFNMEVVCKMSEQEFREVFADKKHIDLDYTWAEIQKINGKKTESKPANRKVRSGDDIIADAGAVQGQGADAVSDQP